MKTTGNNIEFNTKLKYNTLFRKLSQPYKVLDAQISSLTISNLKYDDYGRVDCFIFEINGIRFDAGGFVTGCGRAGLVCNLDIVVLRVGKMGSTFTGGRP